MKFPAIPPNPTNTDLGAALIALHQCVEHGERQTAKNRQVVLKLIATNRTEAGERSDGLEAMIAANAEATAKRFKDNSDAFALYLETENTKSAQLTALLEALPKATKHKPLMAMSQTTASFRIIAMVTAVIVAAPIASKIINAAWLAVTTVLLK